MERKRIRRRRRACMFSKQKTEYKYFACIVGSEMFFFYKQKTAYEISACLVGSE